MIEDSTLKSKPNHGVSLSIYFFLSRFFLSNESGNGSEINVNVTEMKLAYLKETGKRNKNGIKIHWNLVILSSNDQLKNLSWLD